MTQNNQDVLTQLDKLIRLVAVMVTRDKPQREQIAMLSKAGLQPKDIADLIGTTPNTVSVTLSELRRSNTKTRSTTGGSQ